MVPSSTASTASARAAASGSGDSANRPDAVIGRTVSSRELPSVVIPIVELTAVATVVGALLTSPLAGYRALSFAATAGLCLLGLAMLRAWRILLNVQSPNPLTIAQAFAVALTYDVARASALASRAPHHRH